MIVDTSPKLLVFTKYRRRFSLRRGTIRILCFVFFFSSLGLYPLLNHTSEQTSWKSNSTMFGVQKPTISLAEDQDLPRNLQYSCYAQNDKPYLMFGTRTAYHFVHGGETRLEPIPHCKPVQIWMLIRHGTKYPERYVVRRMKTLAKLRDEIIKNHQVRGNGSLCKADLDNLRNWTLDPVVDSKSAEEKLTGQGAEDMINLGRRVKNNFPELFTPAVVSHATGSTYEFRTVNVQRARSSDTAFMSGLLDRVDIPATIVSSHDPLFAAYNNCPRWRTAVANNPEVLKEVNKFKNGPEYRKLISEISLRLGFPKDMTYDSVRNMWEMCRYDKAWRVAELSPWCAVFTDENLRVFEFKEDLTDYYKRGYGHEFNIHLGCPQVQHLFQHFQRLEDGDYSKEPKGVFNVCYSRSLHLFMAAMGLAKDPKPPLASDFSSMDQRLWRTSLIGSYAANVAAVFYKCNGAGSTNKVMFYLAEKPVSYEGCDNGLCDWEYLKNKFLNVTSGCKTDFCQEPDPTAT